MEMPMPVAMPMDKVVSVIEEIGLISVDAIHVVKDYKGGGFMAMIKLAGELLPMIKAAQALIGDAPQALPQLMHMDAEGAAMLGQKSYELIFKVVGAMQK